MTEDVKISQDPPQESNREKAVEILKKIQHENPYLQAVYLWGSVITNDYDPETSDIDSIAIVDEDTDPDLKDKLKMQLEKALPHLKINFLYPSALNGSEPKTLANFISPEILLYDLPNWQHVAGKEFKKEDFELGAVDLESVINSTLESIHSLIERKKREGSDDYPVKGIARLCYLIHQRRMPLKAFSYADLIPDSDEQTREVCEKIMLIRESGDSKDLIKENIALFTAFLNRKP